MSVRRIAAFLSCMMLFPMGMAAQAFLYNVEEVAFFDNREYHDNIWRRSQTLFGERTGLEIGVGVRDENGSSFHKVMVGMNAIQYMGAELDEMKFIPTVYYQYQKDAFRFSMGAVPYSYLSETLPDFIQDDSLVYMRPNIQGGLFQYRSENAFVDFLCDWRGMKAKERNEAFRLLLNGRYQWPIFYAGGRMQMNHVASNASIQTRVSEDLMINPYVGFRVSGEKAIDSLSIEAGCILSCERNRLTNNVSYPKGFLTSLLYKWHSVGLKNTLYVGDNLFPLWPEKGFVLNQGDPMYQSRFYNRTDVFLYIVRRSFVNCSFSWNVHYTRESGIDHSQQLIVSFDLNGLRKRDAYLRNVLGL